MLIVFCSFICTVKLKTTRFCYQNTSIFSSFFFQAWLEKSKCPFSIDVKYFKEIVRYVRSQLKENTRLKIKIGKYKIFKKV